MSKREKESMYIVVWHKGADTVRKSMTDMFDESSKIRNLVAND